MDNNEIKKLAIVSLNNFYYCLFIIINPKTISEIPKILGEVNVSLNTKYPRTRVNDITIGWMCAIAYDTSVLDTTCKSINVPSIEVMAPNVNSERSFLDRLLIHAKSHLLSENM
jgi:hypothetical protein